MYNEPKSVQSSLLPNSGFQWISLKDINHRKHISIGKMNHWYCTTMYVVVREDIDSEVDNSGQSQTSSKQERERV